ncbi:helix-turn-helix transcriptional regulator [Rhizobium pusense]|uniref:winged helix-turn-helix transcriptional regulator n=1 Tax=Agrobacterium pusense TaxID=648995 RepID=UPI001FCCE8AD|nr:helix-turn-helix domain-containing protein [Agrobacterium pusense]MCJ2877639.1 helix-turn-helix transcriptional regulator [Agrobacterium pusense]
MDDMETEQAENGNPDGCKVVGAILDRIGDKWTVMVVGTLSHGPMRFNEIMRQVGGVSHRMLTLTLRGLERDGLVNRTAWPTIPPKVEYRLTDLGRSLIGPLTTLAQWALQSRDAIEAARIEYDLAKSSA